MKKFPTLYKRSSTGAIQLWQITITGNAYIVTEGIQNGKQTVTAPHTCLGKNPGKKNETSPEQQALKEAQAVYDKKLKRGYTIDLAEVDNVTYTKPMKGDKLAERIDEITGPILIQDKLNGVRNQNDAERAYSTGGETFHTIPHIRTELAPIFEDWPDAFLDGEAFNPALRKNLNRLIKLVSVGIKPKDLTPELLAESEKIVQLHLFDGFGFDNITPDMPYTERHAGLVKLLAGYKLKHVHILPYEVLADLKDLPAKMRASKKAGGEGFMLRWGRCEYKEGRSKYMLKAKHFDDAEFEIVELQEGNANWKFHCKRAVLKLPKPVIDRDGKTVTTFASNIYGNAAELKELYENREKVVGQRGTVTYQQLSEYGIPQIPWLLVVRNYE